MINDPNAIATQSTKTIPASAENKPTASSPYRGGIGGMNSRLHLGNQRGQQQNVARNVYDALSAIAGIGAYSGIGEIDIYQLDSAVSNVALSGVIFAMKVEGTNKVLATLVMVEGSEVPRIKPIRAEGYNSTIVELERPLTDLYDDSTAAAVREILFGDYKGLDIDIIDVGANIVPKSLTQGKTVAELTASDAMANILFYAINNLAAVKVDITNNKDQLFSVTWATEDKSARIRANIDLSPAPVFTAAEVPVRSDVSITLGAYSNETGNSAKFNIASDITRVDAYVDLVYVDKTLAANEESLRTGRPVDPNTILQSYAPRVVITRVDSLTPLVTPELSLLGIVSAMALSRENSWIGLFKPKYGIKGVDYRDIGALGFEATHLTEGQVGGRIDVKSDDFNSNPGHLVDFISTAVHQNLSYSQDILECSDLGAIDSLWLSAATGNPHAVQKVIRHADNLTAGRFSTLWNGSQPIASLAHSLIPMGYYTDSNGNLRDLRTIDYLAMLNLYGDQDMPLVEKFSLQTDRVEADPYYRVSVIIDMLKTILGSSVVITGLAHRIDWNSNFLVAVSNAISDTGFTVESNSVGLYTGNVSRRGNASLLSNAVQLNASNSFYTYGGGQRGTQQTAQIYTPYVGR